MQVKANGLFLNPGGLPEIAMSAQEHSEKPIGEKPIIERRQQDFVSAQSFDRLSAAFENSARRWELIVYPSLFAFILLAGYGFYLVYSLAKDVHYLAISVDTNMTVLAGNMQSVSENMGQLTRNVREMNQTMVSIDRSVDNLDPMLTNMQQMGRSMESMSWATNNMRGDMSVLNQNIGRPMSFMNNVMPW